MSVFKDNWNGYEGKKWRVSVRYTDWQGVKKQHNKRGFTTKKEAIEYEREFMSKKQKDITIGFETFVDLYLEDIKPQIKLNTYYTKVHIMENHIKPYFKRKCLSEITSIDILQWQNELLSKRDVAGKGYSQTYLRTVQNQLNAIFNHAYRYYDLKDNPCKKNKKMGKSNAGEMLFWTKDEYTQFSQAIKDKPISYYAFELLYWTGIRMGDDCVIIGLNRKSADKYRLFGLVFSFFAQAGTTKL